MENTVSSTKMRPEEMERQFQTAVGLLKRGDRKRALAYLDQLLAAGSTNPVHLSYRGLAMALTGRGLAEAEAQCKEAMVLGFLEPDIYLNLSRVYGLMRRPEQALAVLRSGIRAIPGEAKILAQLDRLNPRQSATFSVVARDHWLNNAFGKMMRKKANARGRTERDSKNGSGGGKGRVFGISIPTPST